MANKKKKGDVSIETIVIAAIALIVLIILVFVFRTQIGNSINSIIGIGGEAQKCESGFWGTDRICAEQCGQGNAEEYTTLVPGKTDCGEGKKCCEKPSG